MLTSSLFTSLHGNVNNNSPRTRSASMFTKQKSIGFGLNYNCESSSKNRSASVNKVIASNSIDG